MVLYNEDSLRQICPAAFATAPSEAVSDRYSFLPTTEVLELLEGEGWRWHKAMQVKPNIKSATHAKHVIRLRQEGVDPTLTSGSFPELLVVNSHNGTGSYTLRAGIFRLVCSNGMIVSESDFGSIRIRHRGFDPSEVQVASHKIAQQGAKSLEVMNRWQEVSMTRDDQFELARRVAPLRFEQFDDEVVNNLLTTRRVEDKSSDLWTTYNKLQENMLRGGYRNAATSRMVKPITGIHKDIEINSGLWDTASKYYAEASVN